MSDRQRENTAKFLYDMAKGIGLIAVVGGLVGGQVNWWGVLLGLFTMSGLFASPIGWKDGETTMPQLTFFDQLMTVIAFVGVVGAIAMYFYTHPPKKTK